MCRYLGVNVFGEIRRESRSSRRDGRVLTTSTLILAASSKKPVAQFDGSYFRLVEGLPEDTVVETKDIIETFAKGNKAIFAFDQARLDERVNCLRLEAPLTERQYRPVVAKVAKEAQAAVAAG